MISASFDSIWANHRFSLSGKSLKRAESLLNAKNWKTCNNSWQQSSLTETKEKIFVETKKSSTKIRLHKPIYISRCSHKINQQHRYEHSDEFELIKIFDKNYIQAIHLRTNIECFIKQNQVELDEKTPLRLENNDRGVIQRCLMQNNVPGAYLIRRSKNETGSFVLSVSQSSQFSHTVDWHYLIRIDQTKNQFYFPQEKRLTHLRFDNFQQLVNHEQVCSVIPLKCLIPFEIEFEEDLWNIPRRHLTLEYRIGKGEFGEVWRASWTNGSQVIPVALKKLHSIHQSLIKQRDFLREIETLKKLRNNFIVALYGVAKDFLTGEMLVVTELMEYGDLKNWLKSLRDVPPETTIVQYAHDICCGMVYIEKNFHVHRDLACRNLLLASQGKVVKIADFGLSKLVSKDNFHRREETYLEKFPIRWTAPEILQNPNEFSIKSDVWSFGIVLIEIWLKGDDPYPDQGDLCSIQKLVEIGYVHRKPKSCSNQFYNRLILPCLCFKSSERPSFKSLIEILKQWNQEKATYERFNKTYSGDFY